MRLVTSGVGGERAAGFEGRVVARRGGVCGREGSAMYVCMYVCMSRDGSVEL